MKNINPQRPPPNLVMAMFEDGLSTFALPSDASLEELAGHLAHLVKRRKSRPVVFKVRLGAPDLQP